MSTGESSCQQENVSCRQGCVLYRSGFTLCTGWGLVDRNFGLVDLVNKALGLVNKPKWHFEMACMLLMRQGRWGAPPPFQGDSEKPPKTEAGHPRQARSSTEPTPTRRCRHRSTHFDERSKVSLPRSAGVVVYYSWMDRKAMTGSCE